MDSSWTVFAIWILHQVLLMSCSSAMRHEYGSVRSNRGNSGRLKSHPQLQLSGHSKINKNTHKSSVRQHKNRHSLVAKIPSRTYYADDMKEAESASKERNVYYASDERRVEMADPKISKRLEIVGSDERMGMVDPDNLEKNRVKVIDSNDHVGMVDRNNLEKNRIKVIDSNDHVGMVDRDNLEKNRIKVIVSEERVGMVDPDNLEKNRIKVIDSNDHVGMVDRDNLEKNRIKVIDSEERVGMVDPDNLEKNRIKVIDSNDHVGMVDRDNLEKNRIKVIDSEERVGMIDPDLLDKNKRIEAFGSDERVGINPDVVKKNKKKRVVGSGERIVKKDSSDRVHKNLEIGVAHSDEQVEAADQDDNNERNPGADESGSKERKQMAQSEEVPKRVNKEFEKRFAMGFLNTRDAPQMLAEIEAGHLEDHFGSNPHHRFPTEYKDFSRRFVPQYPYIEVQQKHHDREIVPIKATPEEVLAAALKSATEQEQKLYGKPDYASMQKEILRTGDYWNSVWVQEVDPDTVLRTQPKSNNNQVREKSYRADLPRLGSVKAKIMPGSKLYELVSMLKQYSPRLLYVINNRD